RTSTRVITRGGPRRGRMRSTKASGDDRNGMGTGGTGGGGAHLGELCTGGIGLRGVLLASGPPPAAEGEGTPGHAGESEEERRDHHQRRPVRPGACHGRRRRDGRDRAQCESARQSAADRDGPHRIEGGGQNVERQRKGKTQVTSSSLMYRTLLVV